MKKRIYFCIVLIVFIICCMCTNAKAVDTNIFSITDATGSKDEEVTVYINLEKELAFASADLTVEYDTSKLEYVKYTGLELFGKSAMNIVKNNPDNGKIAIGYVSDPSTANQSKKPEQVLSLTFKIISNNGGTTKINLKCTSLKTDAGDSIDVSDKQGTITIVASNNNNSNNNGSNNSNSSNNNTNNNGSQSRTNSTNTSNNTTKTVLPNTGQKYQFITIFTISILIICYYCYKKYKELKEI